MGIPHSPYRRTLLNPFGFGGVKSTLTNPFGIANAPGTTMWKFIGLIIFILVLKFWPTDRGKKAFETVFSHPMITLCVLLIPYQLSGFLYSFVYDRVQSHSHKWIMILINVSIAACFISLM